MKLTKELLRELEVEARMFLTPEQRLIAFHRYGREPRYGFTEQDIIYGIREVVKQYPDHREKPTPAWQLKTDPDCEPF